MEIFKKKYSAEDLSDLSRDIHESFDERFNPVVSSIPKDQYGFQEGTFTVQIVWSNEE